MNHLDLARHTAAVFNLALSGALILVAIAAWWVS